MNRYDRQTRLPQIGEAGQAKLARAKVLLIGCGALGSVIAEQLARAGVGELHVLDRDIVELSNLQRQSLFTESDAQNGIPKALAAAARLRAINSTIKIVPIVTDIHASNIESLIAPVDLVIDGTDNVETRYLLNDAAIKLKKPWIYGGAVGTTGRVMAIIPQQTPCLRCVFNDPHAPGELLTCDTAGVLAAASNVTASLQVTEALRVLVGDPNSGTQLISFDLWPTRFKEFATKGLHRPNCPACGERNFEFLNATAKPAVTLCGRDTVQIRPSANARIDLQAIAKNLGVDASSDLFLRAPLPERDLTLTLFADGRALVHGTSDPAVARSIYAKFIGS